jgi:uncharacterized protein (DUF433 family)
MVIDATPVPSLIYLDEQGRARIQGVRTKVIQIAVDRRNGLDADAIHEAYPYLSLAQIHAALSYYYEHKTQLDAQMEEADREYEALRANAPPSPFVERMQAEGRLP